MLLIATEGPTDPPAYERVVGDEYDRRAVSTEFLLTTLVVVATPGTGVLYTLAAGLSRGARASVVAAFGCTLGIVPHMLAAITGLAALLHTSARRVPDAEVPRRGLPALHGVEHAAGEGRARASTRPAPRSAAKVIVSGVLINILNPKLTIFFFAFLPQFVQQRRGRTRSLHMLELSAVFMLVTFVVFAVYGVFAAAVRSHVISRPRVMTWMRRAFAGAFVALAGRLALTER